jgi:hypothetical protein
MDPDKIKELKKIYNNSDNNYYERPPKTITECIQTRSKIEEQLNNYEEIEQDELEAVRKYTKVKYLSYDINKKKELFRFGGSLIKVEPEYVVLKGKFVFSVQRYTYDDNGKILHTTRFFRKYNEKNDNKNNEDLKDDILKSQLDITIKIANDTIAKQNSIIKKQQMEIEELKNKLKIIKEKELYNYST